MHFECVVSSRAVVVASAANVDTVQHVAWLQRLGAVGVI